MSRWLKLTSSGYAPSRVRHRLVGVSNEVKNCRLLAVIRGTLVIGAEATSAPLLVSKGIMLGRPVYDE